LWLADVPSIAVDDNPSALYGNGVWRQTDAARSATSSSLAAIAGELTMTTFFHSYPDCAQGDERRAEIEIRLEQTLAARMAKTTK
jgi:hypothetical protein